METNREVQWSEEDSVYLESDPLTALSPRKQKGIFEAFAIGFVRSEKGRKYLEVLPQFTLAMQQLEHFSHLIVIWWAHKRDDRKGRQMLATKPPYARDRTTGVFACRSPYRPNPIAISVCPIRSVDISLGRIDIGQIDAADNTPILDLKAYFPVVDRVEGARVPEWIPNWGDCLPEDGIG